MRQVFLCSMAAFLSACIITPPSGDSAEDTGEAILPVDEDQDGIEAGSDCDDTDATIGEATTWYLDLDGDLWGDDNVSEVGCAPWDSYVDSAGDCDDADAAVNPGATEICNGIDDDCEGSVDENAADAAIWYLDLDGDGEGTEVVMAACEMPDGYTDTAGDCVDTDPSINTGAAEVCDQIDQNCDGQIDEGVQNTYFADLDGDLWGDPENAIAACEIPDGYVEDATDCDDADATVNPGATEICNGIDDDCEGSIDENAADAAAWYADVDADGYGDMSVSQSACEAPMGYLADASDCDDTDAAVNPAAIETCDDIDNDCDGAVDPSTSVGVTDWYYDGDGDSWGDSSGVPVTQCDQPAGYLADASDCDDTDAAVNPDGIEVCDGADNDCDGVTDPDDSADAPTWYGDGDGDGYGLSTDTAVACSAPAGYVADATDCDDGNDPVNPGATEVCNEVDDDCDGTIDEGVETTFYGDWDGDGYGNAVITESECEASAGYVADATDCNDRDKDVNPGATEVCDEGVDNDCSGVADDDDTATDASTMSEYYADADEDTYGDASVAELACEAPDGYVEDATDCDDEDVTSYPDAPEVCDGADNDCDGSVDENLYSDWYEDLDGDLFGAGAVVSVICNGSTGSLVDNANDCNDTDATVNPGATETCNGIDDDCDGSVDDGVQTTFYADADSDGYGDASVSDDACSAPSGYVDNATDCNDANEDVNPGVIEVDANGIDDDCDGGTDDLGIYCCLDADADGYGDPSDCMYEGTGVCDSGYVEEDGDCDDGNYSVHADAYDAPGDGADSDCDGSDT
ncbi:putative metal-binding motif-containing protein [Candidatus Uhrbacteria bacterium]|nr:putative metal-binding motif-containing protein [Candidatus Uhrbacteria bacterium]